MQRREKSLLRSRSLEVSTQSLTALAALVGKLPPGHDEILNVLDVASRQDAAASVSLADYCRMLKALSAAAGEETFELSARPMVAGTAEFVFSRAAQSATLGEAMREIARAYNLLHGDAYNRVEFRGGLIVYVLDDEHFPYTRPRDDFLNFSLEFTLIFLHAALCELAGEDLTGRARRVFTRRAATATRSAEALAFWDAPISYGEGVYALAYDIGIASQPLSRRPRHMPLDVAIHNRILSLLESRQASGPDGDGVEAAVVRALRDGLHDQAEIAARLGLSVATLRRKLGQVGASFRALRQGELTRNACLRLIETGDVGETAEALGFSDPRSFTRAFKALTGETPSAFIARAAAQPQNQPRSQPQTAATGGMSDQKARMAG